MRRPPILEAFKYASFRKVWTARFVSQLGDWMQIIGRGRGPNRPGANPLEVVIYGNLVLPRPLDELRVWSPPAIDDELLAVTGHR
jgi:hypothetical protein